MFQILAKECLETRNFLHKLDVLQEQKLESKIKKSRSDYIQNCVLISVATANFRKKKKQRESGAERKRKSRATKTLQMDAKPKDKQIVKKLKEKK